MSLAELLVTCEEATRIKGGKPKIEDFEEGEWEEMLSIVDKMNLPDVRL